MKTLSEFNWKETKHFILTLKSQLALITKDDDLKSAITAIQDAKNGNKTDKTYLDVAYAIFDSLLVTNEAALDIIIASCMQISPLELQKVNNINIIETVIDFFSIEKYKGLFKSAFKSATNGQ